MPGFPWSPCARGSLPFVVDECAQKRLQAAEFILSFEQCDLSSIVYVIRIDRSGIGYCRGIKIVLLNAVIIRKDHIECHDAVSLAIGEQVVLLHICTIITAKRRVCTDIFHDDPIITQSGKIEHDIVA